MKRADGHSLVNNLADAERPPLPGQFGRLQAGGGVFPAAGDQCIRRSTRIGADSDIDPAQRQGGRTAHDLLRREAPHAFRPHEGGYFGRVEDDLGASAQLQQIAVAKVDKHQAGARIQQEIPQRVEEQIAGEIRNRQHAVVVDAHEAGFATAMRGVDLLLAVAHHIRGDVERIGRADHGGGVGIERRQLADRTGGRIGKFILAQPDVLRAVAVSLGHVDVETFAGLAADQSVHAIAATRVQLDAEHADAVAVFHAGVGGIKRIAHQFEREFFGDVGVHEAGPAGAQGGPYFALGIDGAEDHEWQLGVELSMLVGHPGSAHLVAAGTGHAFDNADAALHGQLAFMPRGGRRCDRGCLRCLCRLCRSHDGAPYALCITRPGRWQFSEIRRNRAALRSAPAIGGCADRRSGRRCLRVRWKYTSTRRHRRWWLDPPPAMYG